MEDKLNNQDVGIKVHDSPLLIEANSQGAFVGLKDDTLSLIERSDKNVLKSKVLADKFFMIQYVIPPNKKLIYSYFLDEIRITIVPLENI